MSLEDQIAKAIGAHGMWKIRLASAIDNGHVYRHADVANIGEDNLCALGRWLHGPNIPDAVRENELYLRVRDFHAEFHKCAARVLELVSQGKKARASAIMAENGEYSKISSQLTEALVTWKLTLSHQLASASFGMVKYEFNLGACVP